MICKSSILLFIYCCREINGTFSYFFAWEPSQHFLDLSLHFTVCTVNLDIVWFSDLCAGIFVTIDSLCKNTGMWTASAVVPSSGTWIHHMISEHPGAVSFLVMDTILFTGVLVLTVAQGSQVLLKY